MITSLSKLFFQDFWLKLFSLVMAVLIWFLVYYASIRHSASTPLPFVPLETRTFVSLPVMIMSSAEDVRSVRVNPKEVEVTVQGDPKILRTLEPSQIRVLVDLTGIPAAQALRKRVDVSTPASVSHVRVQPAEVQVIFPSPKS